MSVAQSMAPPDRGVSPLMSNNPFRNRVASNNMQAAGRPVSTNPFLDISELDNLSGSTSTSQPTSNYTTVDKATDIFATMELNQSAAQQNGARIPNGQPRRPENHPPSQRHQFPRPPTAHRPSNSEEEARRIPMSRPKQELDIFADPPELKSRDRERRPRRNSESSVRDKPARMLSPEDEKRRRERKMREKDAAGKDGKDASKSKKPSRKLDVIDKLDVTSIYGTGLFHHDGPFDACNPHRNRKKEKYAPMHAFPKDSVNMIIGGSGPVNNKLDYDKFHGVGKEAHVDYHVAPTAEQSAAPPEFVRKPNGEPQESGFDPNAREVIHGDESQGLGTSTFLEGAPASRTAIQRRESEYEVQQSRDGAPGLSRKKSLAQKIRGVRPNRDRLTSPEGRASASSPPLGTSQSDTVGNPFFKDFEKDKNTAVAFADEPKPNRARAPSSPMRNELERRNTTDSAPDESQPKSGGGFLGRMKSLKGGPRRPARVTTPGA